MNWFRAVLIGGTAVELVIVATCALLLDPR
jgi:hypothetical protein